jgi:outer membrane protein OmpA-like peptidoglycan-associated protein
MPLPLLFPVLSHGGPLRTRAGAVCVLTLALVLVPAGVTRADGDPTAAPSASAPSGIDTSDADLVLPQGDTLAPPKVLDIVSVTDSSASAVDQGEERQETSNSQITYALQADVLFARDSARLNATAAARVRAIAADIRAKKVTSPIRVFGFTDDLGAYQHGKVLSKERADAVYKVLAQALTGGYTFQVRGYSEDYPIADNSTEAGRRQNRRVEITFTPPSGSPGL